MRSSSVSPYDLQDWAKRAGFELTEETLPPLAGYLGLLIQWNRVMNLVGTRTAEDTFFTLVVDSLHLGRFLREDVEYSAAPCSCPRSSPNIPCPEPMSSGAAPKRLWPDRPHGQRISSSAGRLCRGPAFWNSSKAT